MQRWLCAVVMAAWATGCSGDGGETDAVVGDAAAGATLFSQRCVACHGEDGTQGTNGAADLPVVVPTLTDAEIADVLENGKGDMPAQTDDPQEIADLIAYLRQEFGGGS